jgi:hypothetical protein
VHSRMDLLQHIMSLVGTGEWAYIASVSRMARAAYMAAMFDTPAGIPNICRTDAAAAAQSMSRLDMALASSDGSTLVRAQLERLAGDVREWSVTNKLQQLGMVVNKEALLAAARAGSLLSLQRVKQCMVDAGAPPTADDWREVGEELAVHGSGKGPLIWLSQQQDNWPGWYCMLCHWAAVAGHLKTLRFLLDTHGGQAVFGDVVLDVTAEQLESDEWAPYADALTWGDSTVLSLIDNAAYGGNSYAQVAARGLQHALHACHHGAGSIQQSDAGA